MSHEKSKFFPNESLSGYIYGNLVKIVGKVSFWFFWKFRRRRRKFSHKEHQNLKHFLVLCEFSPFHELTFLRCKIYCYCVNTINFQIEAIVKLSKCDHLIRKFQFKVFTLLFFPVSVYSPFTVNVHWSGSEVNIHWHSCIRAENWPVRVPIL